MIEASATEFAKNFGHYKEEAQRQPIAITSYGRVSGYFVSAPEYQEYERLKASMRTSYTIDTLPEELFQSIAGSQVDPRHAHLDRLLDGDE